MCISHNPHNVIVFCFIIQNLMFMHHLRRTALAVAYIQGRAADMIVAKKLATFFSEISEINVRKFMFIDYYFLSPRWQ